MFGARLSLWGRFIASVEEKVCSRCKKKKKKTDFYTMGKRIEARCKQCSKFIKKKRYRKQAKAFKRYRANRITKVIMIKNENMDDKQFKQDLKIAESILVGLFVKIMMKGEKK